MTQKLHQPKHIYLDDTMYFVTASVYQKKPYLSKDKYKSFLLNKMIEFFAKFAYKWFAYVILNNHYHTLFKTRSGKDLGKVFGRVHGSTSYHLNKSNETPGRRVWQSYWDRCIRNKKDFYRHFNYIHQNPVKHKYVDRFEDYRFSSYNHWTAKKGTDWIRDVFEQYPIVDFTVQHDEL